MTNWFDRWMDRLMAGNPRRRIRYIILSAFSLLGLAGFGLWAVASYPLDMKIFAGGTLTLNVADPTQARITLAVDNKFYPSVAVGQTVRVKQLPDIKFVISDKEDVITKDTFAVECQATLPDAATQRQAARVGSIDNAAIIYRRASLFEILLHP